jgi:hypothetical protein
MHMVAAAESRSNADGAAAMVAYTVGRYALTVAPMPTLDPTASATVREQLLNELACVALGDDLDR